MVVRIEMLIRLFVAMLLIAAWSLEATAAGLSGQSGVFKVVKPPSRGARQRLVIHEVTRALPPGVSRTALKHGWFWRVASPQRDAADPARAAVLAEAAARRIGGAGSETVTRRIISDFGRQIAGAARAAGVSEALLIAVVAAESGGDPLATSSQGAQGLAQLMPATAKRFGVSNAYDPAENLRAAAEYLSVLLGMFDEDMLLALAGYNAGENAVLRNDGVPPFNETRNYVPIALSYFHIARRLCRPMPAGARDVCSVRAEG